MKLLLRIVSALALLLIVAFVGYSIWGGLLTDNFFREGLYHSGEQKALVDDFRQYFYRRESYEAMSFQELHKRGIISDHCLEYIESMGYSYQPFSPQTSEDAVVLRLGWPIVGEHFYKRDMIADPNGPDRIAKK